MQAPLGIAQMPEDPITVLIGEDDDGDAQQDVKSDQPSKEFDENLAEDMEDSVLLSIATELLKDYEDDVASRKEWMETYTKGMNLLGLKYEEMTEPWANACGVFHPMLMEAAVKFQSECIMETFPAAGPVRTVIIGKETQDKKEAAARVEADMNYELTERMTEYRPEHERLLLAVSLSGNGFKKIYFDPSFDRQTAPFIPAEDVIVPYGATNLEHAERITHRMRKTPNEVKRLQVADFYRDVELGEPVAIIEEMDKAKKPGESPVSAIVDKRFQLLEMNVNMHLGDHGYNDKHEDKNQIQIPYVVTIEKGTREVLAVRRNWREDDDKLKQRRQHFVHYGYIPGFGFYYYGLIHLIGGHTRAATSLLRQLIDAGTLSNLPGGLKAKGLRIKGDDTPIKPGEFRDIDLPSGTIKDNILPLPYKEPSQVLMALMDKIVEDGQQFAASADLNVSDMSANAPVGTTLAILERVMKVMSAVQARIHNTMRQEFKLLAAIIRDNTSPEYDYDPDSGDRGAKQSDYDMCDVLPVSDPNASTMAQKIVQYQAVLQLAQGAPDIYDMPFLHRQMIEVMGLKNANKIVPMDDDMKPVDPVSENMDILNMKPVKAFMYQDHQSHLAVHMAAMQDPKIMTIVSQNPQAQVIMSAAAAHVMEHLAFEYRNQIQQKLGADLPPPPDPDTDEGYLDPETEVQVSQLAAVAAQQLLTGNTAEQKAAQVAQQQQDPIIQMQQQELQLKGREVDIKEKAANQDAQIKQIQAQADQQIAAANVQKAQMESQIKQLDLQIKAQALELQRMEQERKGKKDMTDAAAKADEISLKEKDQEHRHQMDGAKLGVDISKHRSEQELAGAQLGVQIGQDKAQQQHETSRHASEAIKHISTLEHQADEGRANRANERTKEEAKQKHEAHQAAADRTHELKVAKQQAKAAANKPEGEKK
jgi:hypothetical protein